MAHGPTTADPNRLLREAEAHFVAGRLAAARPPVEQVLRIVPGHPAVLHLHGLILSGLGELGKARAALEAAQRGLPGDPQVANNLGNLLGKLGETAAALAAYDAAIRASPRFAPARLNRAIVLDELGRYAEARVELAALWRIEPPSPRSLIAAASVERGAGDLAAAAARLDEALALDPSDAAARRGRARLAADIGEPDAAERVRHALDRAPDDRELLLAYVAAADDRASRDDAAARLRDALAADPGWRDGQRELAVLRWEEGRRDDYAEGYVAALGARPGDTALWSDYVAALGRAADFAAAARACADAEAATGDPAFAAAAFAYLSAAGDDAAAEALLARLAPGVVTPLALAKHRLRARDPAGAEPLLAAATAQTPDDIEAWALRSIAWQLTGDARFDWLNGQPGLIGVQELPLSEAEAAALVERLRALHARSSDRIGQSLRGGTQTPGNLFDRIEPEFRMLRDVIAAAVEHHRAGMPPADPTHPILRHRDAPLGFAGAWSIRLTGGGFHVQHMHPRGLFSAASYWVVPEPAGDSDPHAGWLEIGGAPAYLALDVAPLRRIEPRPRRLVLFPSTLHHGTRPFPAGERMSVAFDVVARGGGSVR